MAQNEGIKNLQANENFEGVIDKPLASSKGSDHDYTKRKTPGEKTP